MEMTDKEDVMIKKVIQTWIVFSIVFFGASYAAAHCEIPCGIYDDQMRITMISEHITTIEKSMEQIHQLEGAKPVNYNQLIRWVTNKEHHANDLQEVVSQYFMTQRIKFNSEDYTQKLTLLHKLLVSAMKCKQTADLSHINTLRSLLKEFQTVYFHKK